MIFRWIPLYISSHHLALATTDLTDAKPPLFPVETFPLKTMAGSPRPSPAPGTLTTSDRLMPPYSRKMQGRHSRS